jgi:DNA-binding transcriptional ArsR family regulator
MTEIHFTVEDMGRIRIASTIGSTMEAFFAIKQLRNSRNNALEVWRRQVYSRLNARASWFDSMLKGFPSIVEFSAILDAAGKSSADGPQVEDSAQHKAYNAVLQFNRIAIEPYWPQMRSYLLEERNRYAQVLASGGFDLLFEALHSRLQWYSPILEVPDEDSSITKLDGRGLVIVPSIFQSSPATVLSGSKSADRPPILIFSAPPAPSASLRIWRRKEPQEGEEALGFLLGRTRAAVLCTLHESCTTTELAERVHISNAGASQHTTILREAGLITSRRARNKVVHTVTPLGIALIRGEIMKRSS